MRKEFKTEAWQHLQGRLSICCVAAEDLKFMLMNSFSTSKDMQNMLETHGL